MDDLTILNAIEKIERKMDSNFDKIDSKLEKQNDRIYNLDKQLNNDLSHVVADVSASRIVQERIQIDIEKLGFKDEKIIDDNKGQIKNQSSLSAYVDVLMKLAIPAILLIVGTIIGKVLK